MQSAETILVLAGALIAAGAALYSAWSSGNSYVTKMGNDIYAMAKAVQENPIVRTGVWPGISGGKSIAGTQGWTPQ